MTTKRFNVAGQFLIFVTLTVSLCTSATASAPTCDDELLTLFSSGEYELIISRYPPSGSKQWSIESPIRLGLAAMYSWGIGADSSETTRDLLIKSLSEEEIKLTVDYWTQCANIDNIAASTLLGIIYYNGLGIKQDIKTSKQYFEGLTTPIARLGLAATYDRLSQSNITELLINNLISDRVGFNSFKIAELYYHGIIFNKNYASAAKWYERSADEGEYYALGILGYMYTIGLGVEKDQKKGKYWFERQAAHPEFRVDNRRPIIFGIY